MIFFYQEHPVPRVSGYKKRNSIKEVDITQFRVWCNMMQIQIVRVSIFLVVFEAHVDILFFVKVRIL